MIDFLKLTTHNLSMQDVDKILSTANQAGDSNIYKQRGSTKETESSTYANLEQSGQNTSSDGIDQDIEAGFSVVSDANTKFNNVSTALNNKSTELTETKEEIAGCIEIVAQSVSNLAQLLSKEPEEQDENELDKAIEDLVQALEKYKNLIEEKEQLQTSMTELVKAKDEAENELKDYLKIFDEADSDENSDTTIQEYVDSVNNQIDKTNSISQNIGNSNSQRQTESDLQIQETQNQYNIVINGDYSVSQIYEDGSLRKFFIRTDENGNSIICYEDELNNNKDNREKTKK